jgi:hypothetical protein
MMRKLHLDLFCQDKYLLNHVNLKIKQRRSRDAFGFVADAAENVYDYANTLPYNPVSTKIYAITYIFTCMIAWNVLVTNIC